jgi:hypothetical protein
MAQSEYQPKKILINLFAGPNSGKSVLAARLFSDLSILGFSCELALEYARDLVHENRFNVLQHDQAYILAKQNRRISRVIEQVDFVICDSPLLLTCTYNNPESINQQALSDLCFSLHEKYQSINIFIERNSSFKFSTVGRTQSHIEEAIAIDIKIKNMLKQFKVPYFELENNAYIMTQIATILNIQYDKNLLEKVYGFNPR